MQKRGTCPLGGVPGVILHPLTSHPTAQRAKSFLGAVAVQILLLRAYGPTLFFGLFGRSFSSSLFLPYRPKDKKLVWGRSDPKPVRRALRPAGAPQGFRAVVPHSLFSCPTAQRTKSFPWAVAIQNLFDRHYGPQDPAEFPSRSFSNSLFLPYRPKGKIFRWAVAGPALPALRADRVG